MEPELERLRETVGAYEARVEEAGREVGRARERLVLAERELALARNFLEMESRRLHQKAAGITRRFRGLSLRDACIAIIRERGQATSQEIRKALAADGYTFDTRFPGRSIHTALMRASEVRKVAPGTYKYLGVDRVR